MSLDKPIVELIEEYLANSSNPSEHELLSGIFKDTREEYSRATLVENEEHEKFCEKLSKDRREYWDERHERSMLHKYGHLKPPTLEDLAMSFYLFGKKDGNHNPICDFYDHPRSNFEAGLMESEQYFGFTEKNSGLGIQERIKRTREGELLIYRIIKIFLEKEGIQSKEIEDLFSHRKDFLDYFMATKEIRLERLSEETTFQGLSSKISHFCRSSVRNEYFEALLEMAKTKEELFFVVKHGLRCPCWPKAVRRLARIKDLSPIEKIK